MSNVRLSNIIPDVLVGSTVVLPGTLSLTNLNVTSQTDSTTLSLASSVFSGGISIGKTMLLGGNVTFANATGNAIMNQNTASSSDTKGLFLSGSGSSATDSTRGSSLELYGNQSTGNTGNIRLTTGTSGILSIFSGATQSVSISSTGVTTLNGNIASTSVSTGSLILPTGGVSIGITTDSTSLTSGGSLTVAGGSSIGKSLFIGSRFDQATSTYNNFTTAASGTVSQWAYNQVGIPTLTATNASIITTNASTFYISGAPIASTNQTLTNRYALQVASGVTILQDTTDTVSASTGAFQVLGGVGIAKSLFVGGVAYLGGVTANLNATAGQIMNINTDASVVITGSADSTSSVTGAFKVAGGVAIAKNVTIGSSSISLSTTTAIGSTGSILNLTSTTTPLNIGFSTNPANALGDFSINDYTNSRPILSYFTATSQITLGGTATTVKINNVGDSTTSTTGSLQVLGGIGIAKSLSVGGSLLNLTNATSNTILYSNAGIASPSLTTRSVGTKLVLYPSLSSTSADFALGIEGGNMWFSIDAGAANGFKWYSGTTVIQSVSLDASILNVTTDTNSLSTGAFRVAGGVSVAKSMTVGKNIYIDATTGSIRKQGLVVNAFDVSVVIGNSLGTSNLPSIQVWSNGGFGTVGITPYALEIQPAGGDLTIGSSTSIVNFNGLTDSSLSTNGALVIHGGVGIIKNLSIGANMSVTGTSSLTGVVSVLNATESSTLSVASVILSGGLSVNKSIRVGINATIAGSLTVSGAITLLNSTVSSSSTTGSMVLTGGLGVGGAINTTGALSIGGNATISGTLTTTGVSTFSNVTDATTTVLGSIVTAGGIGVSKSVNIGLNLTSGGTTTLSTLNSTGIISFTNATDSTSSTVGAVMITGGAGIAKRLYVGGNATITGTTTLVGATTISNATDSSNTTNGALLITGGVGVGMNLNVGGGLAVAATSLFIGSIQNTAGNFSLNTISLTDGSGILTASSPAPSFRIAGNNAIKTTQYANSMEMFSLGNTYTDTNHEALQLTTISTNTYTIMSRNAGTGVQRRLVLQSGGTNTNQMVLNTDGSINLSSVTTDSTSTSTGSVTVSGGLGVKNSVSIGKNLQIFGATSGSINIVSPSTVSSYTLTLPTEAPAVNGYVLTSTTGGVLSWVTKVDVGTSTSSNVVITGTDESTTADTGALRVAGGAGIAKNLNVTGNVSVGSNTGNKYLIMNSAGNSGTNAIYMSHNGTIGTTLSVNNNVKAGIFSTAVGDNGRTNMIFAINTLADSSNVASSNAVISLNGSTGAVSFSITTDSTSTSTGSVQIAGGLGLSKTLFAGGSAVTGSHLFQNNSTANDTVAFQSVNAAGFSSIKFLDNTGTFKGSLGYANVGVAGSFGDQIFINSVSSMIISAPLVIYPNTTDSSSTTTGAVKIAGGANVAKALTVGSQVNILTGSATEGISIKTGLNTSANRQLWIMDSALQASSPTNMVFRVGILASTTYIGACSTDNSTALPLTVMNSQFIVNNTNTSNSTSTGALLVTGGAGIGGALFLGGNLNLPVGGSMVLKGSTSGTLTVVPPATVTTSYTLTLPAAPPSSTGQILISDTTGKLSFVNRTQSLFFVGSNNVTTAAPVTGLTVSGIFEVKVRVITVGTTTLTDMYELRGYPLSGGGYMLYQSRLGGSATTGITFSVDSAGQIYYTSPGFAGFVSTTFDWISNVTSPTVPQLASTRRNGNNIMVDDSLSTNRSTNLYNSNQMSSINSLPENSLPSSIYYNNQSPNGIISEAKNNVQIPTNVDNVVMTGSMFSADVLVSIYTKKVANNVALWYRLEGLYQPSKQNWIMTQHITVAPNVETGIRFFIAANGQIQYVAKTDTEDWEKTEFNFMVRNNGAHGINKHENNYSQPKSNNYGSMYVVDQKNSGEKGGILKAGIQNRVLNTVVFNTIDSASLTDKNEIVLPPGNYKIEVSAPANNVQKHKILLYNVSDAIVFAYGTNENGNSRSTLTTMMNIEKDTTFTIQHYNEKESKLEEGLGSPVNIENVPEIYTTVMISAV